jgi:hydrogenase expression/formation protein HypC
MCLAVPMKLVERNDVLGTVELDGVRREISLMLEPEAKLGDFLLVHAGYAIGVVDEGEAQATLDLLRQVGDLDRLEP